jgi:hypothetical protein
MREQTLIVRRANFDEESQYVIDGKRYVLVSWSVAIVDSETVGDAFRRALTGYTKRDNARRTP